MKYPKNSLGISKEKLRNQRAIYVNQIAEFDGTDKQMDRLLPHNTPSASKQSGLIQWTTRWSTMGCPFP